MSVNLPIYLDYQSTTPVDPRVLEAMLPYFTLIYGNHSSTTHVFGQQVQEAVEDSRRTISGAINALPEEIILTSGATEALNLAIKGVAENYSEDGGHLITSAIEHSAVLECFEYLRRRGFSVTVLPVDSAGRVSMDGIAQSIRNDTILISVIAANNEIGTLQPIGQIGELCHQRGILFLTDATQWFGKLPLDVQDFNIDLMACSSHKIYGPKGVGALYVRKNTRLAPLIHGGGQERGLRSGTLNTPGIVGFGSAVEIALQSMNEENIRIRELRDHLQNQFLLELEHVILNGHPDHRLPSNLNMSFMGADSDLLMARLEEEIAVSSGSACSSGAIKSSHVLIALGLDDDVASCSIRFGLGRFTTQEEIVYVADRIIDEVRSIRDISPDYDQIVGKYSGKIENGLMKV